MSRNTFGVITTLHRFALNKRNVKYDSVTYYHPMKLYNSKILNSIFILKTNNSVE